MRYLFAKVRGDSGEIMRDSIIDIVSFEFIETDPFLDEGLSVPGFIKSYHLGILNKFIKDKSESYPTMNNSDYNAMVNLGRTTIYVERENIIPTKYLKPKVETAMIIDLEHSNNKEIKRIVKISQIVNDENR